jgi:hypothetical protein
MSITLWYENSINLDNIPPLCNILEIRNKFDNIESDRVYNLPYYLTYLKVHHMYAVKVYKNRITEINIACESIYKQPRYISYINCDLLIWNNSYDFDKLVSLDTIWLYISAVNMSYTLGARYTNDYCSYKMKQLSLTAELGFYTNYMHASFMENMPFALDELYIMDWHDIIYKFGSKSLVALMPKYFRNNHLVRID